MSEERLRIECPCCKSVLEVDAQTGLVLRQSQPKKGFSFEEALAEVETKKAKADQLFEQAFVEEKRRHEILEKKFKKALESKDELEEPLRPLDLD